MTRFLVRRLVLGIFVVWAVATVTFFAIHSTGDPITTGLQESGASLADIARIKHELGFDRPIIVQYGSYLIDMLHGDFGNSFVYGSSASGLVFDRLPATLHLAAAALLLTIVIAVPLGVLAAYRPGSNADRLVTLFAGAGQSIPNFVIGPLFILLFAVTLKVLPAAGMGRATAIILPAVTLALYPIGRVIRMTRTTAIRVMKMEFIDTARSKGISERSILLRHVVRNSLISVITLLGLELAALIGGAVITENIFGWPGIGTLARQAFASSDFPLAQAIVIVVAVIVVSVNLLTDLAYSIADPRIRVS